MKKFSVKKLNSLLEDPVISSSGVMRIAGLSYSGFQKIRKGESVPSSNTLAAIAAALNKPLEYFFEEESLYKDNFPAEEAV